jgi:branched-chain amino acid transport system permease protein
MTYLIYLVLGLGSGAIYAVIALGLVLQFKGSRVINFAFATMMMTSTLVYAGVRSLGVVIIPIPGLPDIPVGNGVIVACVAAFAVAVLIALAMHFLVFRWLRKAPAISRAAAAVGAMLTLEAVAALHYSKVNVAPPGVLPATPLHFFGARIPEDRLLLGLIAVVLAGGLWALFKFSMIGLAIRASAENDRGAAILGWSEHRLALLTWLGAAVMAGGMGILIAPIAAQDPVVYTLMIIPGLAAALLARFRSFVVCAGAGLVLGMVQSVLTKVALDVSWLPKIGLSDGVPFLVIILVLALNGTALPSRGTDDTLRQPVAYAPRNVARRTTILLVVAVIAVFLTHGAARYALVASMIGTLLALSIVVLTGYAGLISLSQYAFAGVAGFSVSKLAAGAGVPFPLTILFAALIAAALGLIIGLPSLRLRGINLAIVTLAAGAAVNSLLFQNPSFSGGYDGARIPRPTLFGWDLGIDAGNGEASLSFSLVCLAIVAGACLAVSNLRRSGTGRRMLAVRANERAAAAAGINVAQVKMIAFAMSAFIAGVAGSLLAYSQVGGNLSFNGFGPLDSIVLLTVAFIGGVSTVAGAVLAGIAVAGGLLSFAFVNIIPNYDKWQALIGGIGLMLVAIQQPDGVAGYNIALFQRIRAARRNRKKPVSEVGVSTPAIVVVEEDQRAEIGPG